MPSPDPKRNRKRLILLLPLGVILGGVGALLLLYALASNAGEGTDPSPLPLIGAPFAAILLAAGIGAVVWALTSRRGGG